VWGITFGERCEFLQSEAGGEGILEEEVGEIRSFHATWGSKRYTFQILRKKVLDDRTGELSGPL